MLTQVWRGEKTPGWQPWGTGVYWSDLQKEGLDHWRGEGGNRIVKGGSGVPSLGHCGILKQGQRQGTGSVVRSSVWYYEECRGVQFWMFGYFTVKPLREMLFKLLEKQPQSLGYAEREPVHLYCVLILAILRKRDFSITDCTPGILCLEVFFLLGPLSGQRRIPPTSVTSACLQGRLTYHNGWKFTNLDRDNDIALSNCALTHHGGWWYKNCHLANPNGRCTGRPSIVR